MENIKSNNLNVTNQNQPNLVCLVTNGENLKNISIVEAHETSNDTKNFSVQKAENNPAFGSTLIAYGGYTKL